MGLTWGTPQEIMPYSEVHMVATDSAGNQQIDYLLSYEWGTADTITSDNMAMYPTNSPYYDQVQKLLKNSVMST
jgi:hypothetical protein